MKKLMILGGSRYALPVIDAAHKLGIYVITCDYLPDNIAHKYSDEYCNVSIIDKEKTLEYAQKLEPKIDEKNQEQNVQEPKAEEQDEKKEEKPKKTLIRKSTKGAKEKKDDKKE